MRGLWSLVLVLACLPASLSSVAAAASSDRQAAYNLAQAAFDRQDWQAAADGFAPLLPADPAKPLGRSGGVIAVRLADAQLHLNRLDEAAATARRGLAAVPDEDAATLAEGWTTIGDVARFQYDYDDARAAYARAIGFATRSGDLWTRIAAVGSYAMVMATVDPAAATAPLDALLDDAAMVKPLAPPERAGLEELRARLALNAGDPPTAARFIDRALQHSGGSEGLRVNQLQITIRGDASIVAKLRNDEEGMRRYLTFSGAGHLDSTDWLGQMSGDLPVCDGVSLKPDDFAVVQLSIASDGHVAGAMPVYASRTGAVGASFARAVGDWRWDAAAIAKVKPFWLQGLRLELRCETRPRPEALYSPVVEAVDRWRAATHPEAADWTLRRSSPTGQGLPDVALLSTPAADHGVGDRPPPPTPARVVPIGEAPPEAYALAILATARSGTASDFRQQARAMAAYLGAAVPPFVARHPDSIASPWLLVEWGNALERAGDFIDARAPLEQALATPKSVLPEDAPIRQVATLHLTVVRRRLGDAAGADAAIRTAGLDAEQCSLVDTKPVPTNLSMVSSQFPTEAMRWQFEGYVRVAYDIGADGRVANIRTVIAYPPFVFGPATEQAARAFRYAAPTIAGKPVGCSGETQSVNYRIPR